MYAASLPHLLHCTLGRPQGTLSHVREGTQGVDLTIMEPSEPGQAWEEQKTWARWLHVPTVHTDGP